MRHGLRHVIAALGLGLSLPAVAQTPDVPPEIPVEVYKDRRERLMRQMKNCVGVLKSHSTAETPDRDFFYLTGITEPGAVLMLAPKEPHQRQALFLAPRDPEAEIWTGYREEMAPALREKYGMDYVGRTRGEAPRGFKNAMRRTRCYAELRPAFDKMPGLSPEVLGEYLTAFDAKTEQVWLPIEDMRALKDEHELALLKKAINQTHHGHEAAIRALGPEVSERQVQGAIEQAFYAAGATGVAFDSIVGSGPNGAVLHWKDNDRKVGRDDLVVVDIGASYGGYAADITRTYPVNGQFNANQLELYNLVLGVQDQVIAAVQPGVSLQDLDKIARDALEAAGHPFPHFIGHFVGIEVHDVGDRTRPLEQGMVVTVEPGAYIAGRHGVRIEDMVLVTRSGSDVLTRDLPRKSQDVEAWMSRIRKESMPLNRKM